MRVEKKKSQKLPWMNCMTLYPVNPNASCVSFTHQRQIKAGKVIQCVTLSVEKEYHNHSVKCVCTNPKSL